MQDPPYGADVLRLWVASVDATTGDVSVGPTILAQVLLVSHLPVMFSPSAQCVSETWPVAVLQP